MTHIEQRLRATLHDRVGDITTLPAYLLDDAPHRVRPRWILPVAAAAVVLVVAGIVLGLRNGDRDRSAVPPGPSCTTNLPDAWGAAIRDAAVDVPPGSRTLAILNDGTLVVQEQGGDALGDNGTVHAVSPSGSDRMLFTLPFVSILQPFVRPVGHSEFVIAMTVSNGTSARHTLAIYLVDTATGTRTTIAQSSTGSIGGVAVLDETVLYDVHPNATSEAGSVQAYDIPEARHRVQYRDSIVGTVHGTPIGVDWVSGSIDADLPDNVKHTLSQDAVSDGTAYASTSQGGIVWADRDGLVRGPFRQHVASAPVVNAVVGPYVFFHARDAAALYVLDTRTRAVAATGLNPRGAMPAGGGYVAFGSPIARLDTNGLPELRC